MLSPLNKKSETAKRFPELIRAYDARISEFNAAMINEAKIAVPLLIGGWLVLLFVSERAERFDPAFRTVGIFLLLVSIGYGWSRHYRSRSEEKKILNALSFEIALLSDQESEADRDETKNADAAAGGNHP
jgi:hypothetical protein